MSKRNSIKKSKGPVEPEVEEAKGHNPKEDAAVGSISHILRTLFRGLYEDEAREKAEAEEQEKLQAEQDAKAQKKAKKKGKAKKGAKTGREAAVEDGVARRDDDDGAVEHGDAPWFDASHLKDVEHTKALAARRQDAIAARLGRQQKQADGLLAYMGEQIASPRRPTRRRSGR
ncbi:hypothetical protein JL720_1369 [Aureococcus anophagefferens]|nr:hypothetical protein JL720_1369 [Aureococcus anophagefferens]